MIEAIGNRAQTEILHWLTTDGPLTTAEVAVYLDITRPAAHHHLVALERSGLINADIAPVTRPGRITHWRVDPARVHAALRVWAAYAVGE